MIDIDWSKAPEGATHYVEGSTYPWEKFKNGQWFYYSDELREWINLGLYSYEKRFTGVSENIHKIPALEWDGEGLPSVGAKVEYCWARKWYDAEVVYVCQDTDNICVKYKQGNEFILDVCCLESIQPKQTEEDKMINELSDFLYNNNHHTSKYLARKLYNLGYRKTEEEED